MKTLKDTEKISTIIKHLISEKKEITIILNGQKNEFTSRISKINQDPFSSSINERSSIIIERLYPENGNTFIQSASKVTLSFFLAERFCRCSVDYLGISSTTPHFGFFLKIPEMIEIDEKRDEERVYYEIPDFVSAEFIIGKGSKREKVFSLDVINCSSRGLCLIVTEKDFDLLGRVKIGDRINNMMFFATWTMIKINCSVRHITKIEEGKLKGCYQIGIESDDIISACNPKNNGKELL